MTQYEKSAATLELPAILAMLARHAVSDAAKERALAVSPSTDAATVKRLLAETSAARGMMVKRGGPSFSGVKDVRASLSRADMGGCLNIRELMDIAGVLGAARQARSYAAGDGRGNEKTCIDGLFNSLITNRFLEDKITGSIAGEDELADAASPELASIRRLIRAASARVRDALQKIISSPSYAKALQDPIITTRSERYVVPVKAEFKNAVPGLVHDVSASGATLFIEPMAAVKANNELRELRAREKAEVERILMELSADCAEHADDITRDFGILVSLDLIFAKAKLSYEYDGMEPEISERAISLRRARHPLLPKDTAVPIDLELGGDYDTLVITGPNTGGKTVTLKTIGLMCAMAACGLHLPVADGSCVPVFDAVLADIGDEQSIEQSLSTFSSHMTNIVRILNECGPSTLILFDELGAGTDPTEGAALAISIIEYARARGAVIAATTHYAELKVYATTAKGVMNASCEFDVATLRPTYRLLVGIPGKSNAFAISERLGVPAEIIADAKGRVGTESASFEATIEKLESVRQALERDRDEAQRKLREAEENRKESAKIKIELSMRLEKAELKAKRDAERIIAEARETAEAAFAEIDEMRARMNDEEDHRAANEARAALRRRLNEAEESFAEKPAMPEEKRGPTRPAVVGDTVELLSMGVKAEVTGINKDGSLSLRAGIMNVTARQEEVRVTEAQPKKKVASTGNTTFRQAAVAPELDLRGMETLEAIPVMERYIDSAVMGKLHTVTIIHGKGTGALRQAVQQALRKNKAVKSFRLGRYGEGETGVTVVELK
ncbi:MAG TPA: endonuclease MutS2 [Candidatus Scatomorpha intestinigallinarum]|uniref:Endonuclease MutS2 n=1 Tax=Candidatus Scatomorpha intestinigallinarum TaxID=2840923 RepID=A0A9D1DKV9_9FIRM|nr:endonuclease MutS2 [Candidatus Scatomorpha intestinigallinarum]